MAKAPLFALKFQRAILGFDLRTMVSELQQLMEPDDVDFTETFLELTEKLAKSHNNTYQLKRNKDLNYKRHANFSLASNISQQYAQQ